MESDCSTNRATVITQQLAQLQYDVGIVDITTCSKGSRSALFALLNWIAWRDLTTYIKHPEIIRSADDIVFFAARAMLLLVVVAARKSLRWRSQKV